MKDLAEYLQEEVQKTSIRKVAARIGISKTTVANIAGRKLKNMPEVETLEKIAAAYELTLPAVAEMAGAMSGDGEKAARIARELERSPWIINRLDELLRMSEKDFNYFLDWVKWRKKNPPPDESPPPPTE